MSSSKTLKAEIQSHGANYEEYFKFEVLLTCGDRNSLQLAETAMIIKEDCIHNDNNYNRSIPGQRFLGPTEHTPETKEKMRQASLGENNPMYGSTHSDETKDKIRQAQLGDKSHSFKDVILGVHTKTGETVEFVGAIALNEAGFKHGNVYSCINGKTYWQKDERHPEGGYYFTRSVYKGYKWYRRSEYYE